MILVTPRSRGRTPDDRGERARAVFRFRAAPDASAATRGGGERDGVDDERPPNEAGLAPDVHRSATTTRARVRAGNSVVAFKFFAGDTAVFFSQTTRIRHERLAKARGGRGKILMSTMFTETSSSSTSTHVPRREALHRFDVGARWHPVTQSCQSFSSPA